MLLHILNSVLCASHIFIIYTVPMIMTCVLNIKCLFGYPYNMSLFKFGGNLLNVK